MLFIFLGTLSLQLGHLFKLPNIPGKALLSFLVSLVQTQGYFFFYLLFPNFNFNKKMDEGHFPWKNKWGSQSEKGRDIAWES